jgi:hypothetical protein
MHRSILFRFTAAALLLLMLPGWAWGKRAVPAKVEPVVFEGVRYVAPNDKGRRAYIQAWDVKTEKKLWELTVFRNWIDPTSEEDVQHVYIKKLTVKDGVLVVTAENGKVYRVSLKERKVLK